MKVTKDTIPYTNRIDQKNTLNTAKEILNLEMIIIQKEKISQDVLANECEALFKTMVKGVIDIERNIIALGAELHADLESLLLEKDSRQSDLWGFNFYPWNLPDDRIEFTSFINIRPSQNNFSMEIESEDIRKLIIESCHTLLLSSDENMDLK